MPIGDASFYEETPLDVNPDQMNMGQEDAIANQKDEIPNDMNMGGENIPSETDDSTMGIINQLSSDDKDAVRAYAESLLKKDESQETDEEEPIADGLNMEEPMSDNISESVIFTKRQLKKINENFNYEDELEKPLNKKAKQNISRKSPFNAPKFD